MKRFVVSVMVIGALLVGATIARAQQRPQLFTRHVDLDVPAGAVTLEIRRDLQPQPAPGLLGTRWMLMLAGFGDPISLEGKPTAESPSTDYIDTLDNRNRLTGRRDRRGNTITLSYDSQGRIATVSAPKSVSLEFGLDRAGKLTAIRSTRGEVAYTLTAGELTDVRVNGGPPLRYAYEPAGPSRIEDPTTGTVDVTYDTAGRVSGYRWADGSSMRFTFDATTRLDTLVDTSGGTTTIQDRGGVVEIIDAGGQRWTSVWDPVSRTRIETAPDQSITRTRLDDRDRPLSEIDPVGRTTTYEYTERGDLAAIALPGGARRTFEYDAFGSMTGERLDGQLIRSFTYHADGALASARGLNWPERRYAYDAAGFMRSVATAGRGTVTFDRDQRGNVISLTNALGGVTVRNFDAQNRLVSETTPAGATSRWRYDEGGRVVEHLDGAGNASRFDYDGRGRVTQRMDAAGVTRYEYNAAGRIVRLTSPGQSPISYAYDTVGRLVRESGPSGDRVFAYDALGRMTRARDADGRAIVFAYNTAGDVAEREDAFGGRSRIELDPAGRVARVGVADATTQYQYDPLGRLRAVVDPLGHERHVSFGTHGTLTAAHTAGGDEAFFAYDLDGLLTGVTRASGGTERFEYDAAGHVTAVVSPNGGRQTLAYDSSGRLTSSIDAEGQAITYSWDALGHLTAREFNDGTRHVLSYDTAGRLTQTGDGRHSMRYTYDQAGRVTSVEFAAAKKTVRSEYGANGQRQHLIDGDGRTTSYDYTASGQVSSIRMSSGARIGIAYDGAGRMRSLHLPNGLMATWEYDGRGRPTRVAYADATGRALVVDERRYDAAGNVVERRNEQGRVTRFAYDNADQLVGEALPGSTTRLTYGRGGNRVAVHTSAASVTYEYDAADHLLTVESTTQPAAGTAEPTSTTTRYSFDRRGALERRGTSSFTFDPLLRLTGAPAVDGGAAVTFDYAVTGERLARRDRTGVTQFIYDGLNLLQEVDAAGRTLASYVHGPGVDRPLVMEKAGQSYYFLADLGGNVAAIADAQGRIVSTYDYDAFGAIREKKESVTSPFGFSGRELDAATGLYYFRARYYDPALGRFISTDPVAPVADEPLSFNPYIYVLNNPGRFSDPTGLAPIDPLPPDWSNISGALQSALQSGVPVPRGGLAAASFDDLSPINQQISLNDIIGHDEVTPKDGIRRPGRPPVGPGYRDGSFRRPTKDVFINQPGRTAPVPIGPGYRDPGFRRPTYDVFINQPGRVPPRVSPPSLPGSSERLIEDMLRRPGSPPPVRPPAPTPRVGPPSAEDIIADLLKQPARPPVPAPPAVAPGVRDQGFRPPDNFGKPVTTPPPATPPPATAPPATPPTPPAAGTSSAPGTPNLPPPTSATGTGTGTPPATSGATAGTPTLRDPVPPPRAPADGNTRVTPRPQQPDSSMRAPRAAATLTIVMTAAQIAQCYKAGYPFQACVDSVIKGALTRQAGLLVVGTAIVVVANAVGGPTLCIAVVTAVATAGMVAGAAGAIQWSIQELSGEYNSFVTAASAMDQADAAVATRIDQLQLRLRRLTTLRGGVAQSNIDDRLAVRRVATEVATLKGAVDELEQRVAEIESAGGANSCQALSTLQSQLSTYRSAGAAELRQLEAEVQDMRNRLASCRTAADSEALRLAWARNAQRADAIDAAVASATSVRARLLEEVQQTRPGQLASQADSVRTTVTLMRERLREVQDAAVLADVTVGTTQKLEEYRTGIAAIRAELADAKASVTYDRNWKEWIIESLRPWALNLEARFSAFARDLDAEASRMGDARSTVQASQERDQVYGDASALVRRADSLIGRLNAAGCSFADDATVLDGLRRRQGDARALIEESDRIFSVSDRCVSGTSPAMPEPRDPPAPRFTPNPPSVLRATLECASSWIMSGSVLEIVSGGRPETCNIRVTGWNSKTTAPVEVLFSPFAPGSGVRAAPGDTEIGGDVMYAAGVNDRFGEYVFGQGFSTPRGAPTSVNPIVITVRQEGHGEVRLPLTINVVQDRDPVGGSLTPPTPVLGGTAVPGRDIAYCVFQYKIFGDPPACWHFAAAACGTPRYTGRREYQLVGTGMTQREADLRVFELSRYHLDALGCRAAGADEPPVDPPPPPSVPVGSDPAVAPPPTPPVTDPEPVTPRPRVPGRFGLSPTGVRIKVGETVRIQAFGVYSDAPDMAIAMTDVAWSGDKPPTFTATAADKGKTFWIYATGPGGIKAQTTVTVDAELPDPPAGTVPDIFSGTTTRPDAPVRPDTTRPDTTTRPGTPTTPPAAAGAPGAPDPAPSGANAPPGSLKLVSTTVAESTTDSCCGRLITYTRSATSGSMTAQYEPGSLSNATIQWKFSGVPGSLTPGEEITITITGSVTRGAPFPGSPSAQVSAQGLTDVKAEHAWVNTDKPFQGGTYVFRVPANATSATITLSADYNIGTIATYRYAKQ